MQQIGVIALSTYVLLSVVVIYLWITLSSIHTKLNNLEATNEKLMRGINTAIGVAARSKGSTDV